MSEQWYNCDHEWQEPVDSQYENEVYCTICGVLGDIDRKTGKIYWPAT